MYYCTTAKCGCGEPVEFRMVNGYRTPLHAAELLAYYCPDLRR